jgi:hypothetical protein
VRLLPLSFLLALGYLVVFLMDEARWWTDALACPLTDTSAMCVL